MQDGIIIDSGAWTILVNPRHPSHARIRELAQGYINCLPTAVVGELFFGAFNQPERIEIRVREISNRLRPFRIIRPDLEICSIWGQLMCQRKRDFGDTKVVKDYTDIWIAATAIRWKFPVITLNSKDFNWINGLMVFSII